MDAKFDIAIFNVLWICISHFRSNLSWGILENQQFSCSTGITGRVTLLMRLATGRVIRALERSNQYRVLESIFTPLATQSMSCGVSVGIV
jgi:hypothetical protein